MKKTVFVCCAVFVAMCFFNVPKAHAVGIGLYGSGGGGSADWFEHDDRFSKSTTHLSAGFALDTAPAGDGLFNYNLNIGYDRFKNTNASAWNDAMLDGFVMSNSFGFGTLITRDIRLWVGPELRLSWHEGSPDHFPDYTIRLFGIGIGPAIGLNFNVGERLTFVLKGGYQFINYYGNGEGQFSHTTNNASSRNDYYYHPREHFGYVTLEMLLNTSQRKNQ